MSGYALFFWPAIAGICFYAALLHLQSGLRRPIDKMPILVGLLALSLGVALWGNFELAGELSRASDVSNHRSAGRLSAITWPLAFTLVPWCVTHYADEPHRRFAAVVSSLYAAITIGIALEFHGSELLWVPNAAVILYLIVACVALFRRGPRFRAWGLTLGAAPFALSLAVSLLIHDAMQAANALAFGLLAMVLAMSTTLTRERQKTHRDMQTALRNLRELTAALERRIARRTEESSQLSAELEAFAYSVSHDLRAPLAAMNGFAELLLREHGFKLDQNGHRYIQRIRDGSLRLAGLIQALVDLSRIAQTVLERVPTDLAPMSEIAIKTLREADATRTVTAIIPHSLPANGDSKLLALAINNLVANAWKYTSKCTDARIEVGSVDQSGETAYFVKDNGAGFNPTHVDRLFRPFVRLHAESEFPGTGMGLATAARIIRKHGGRIWAEGKPNAGATFYFTLPVEEGQLPTEIYTPTGPLSTR